MQASAVHWVLQNQAQVVATLAAIGGLARKSSK